VAQVVNNAFIGQAGGVQARQVKLFFHEISFRMGSLTTGEFDLKLVITRITGKNIIMLGQHFRPGSWSILAENKLGTGNSKPVVVTGADDRTDV